jgi:hypothetical protein
MENTSLTQEVVNKKSREIIENFIEAKVIFNIIRL